MSENEEDYQKRIAAIDQLSAEIRDVCIPALYSFYSAAVNAGFNKVQAFELVKLMFANSLNGDK